MEWRLTCPSSAVVWIYSVLFYMAGAKGEVSHTHSTLSISALHLHYTCPEGSTAKLACSQRGAPLHPTDVLKHVWLFQPRSEQHCTGRLGPRNTTIGSRSHDRHAAGWQDGAAEHNFWLTLQNVTHADQGRYCCVALDYQVEHNHGPVKQTHSHVILKVTQRRSGSQDCTVLDPAPPTGFVATALALAACVFALLSLPVILVLVYKQRQNARSSRRAQELVRMDSECHGHENPMFLTGSPQIRTRTVSQIMTRQSSETGRHLLSEPGTPLSPPAQGDVFFSIEDTISESPEFLQV